MKLKSRFQVKDLSLCSSSAHCCLQIREEGCWVNLSFDNCHHASFPLGGLASRNGAASGKSCLERCVQEGDTLHGNAVLWNRRKPEESQRESQASLQSTLHGTALVPGWEITTASIPLTWGCSRLPTLLRPSQKNLFGTISF